MGCKAIDVVILPDQAMTAKAVEENRKLVAKYGPEIVLNKQNCLPHISLAMACINEEDMPAIENILKDIAEKTRLATMKAIGIHTSTSSSGEKVSVFEVAKTDALRKLHEQVTSRLTPHLSYDVSADMLYNPDEVRESTLGWIRNYRVKSSFEHFFPHITIGYGEASRPSFPIEFSADKLALCHLGNHCTCREILTSTQLKG
jgi:2'-5' RNA ligase